MSNTANEIKSILDSMYIQIHLREVDELEALTDAMELIKTEVGYHDD